MADFQEPVELAIAYGDTADTADRGARGVGDIAATQSVQRLFLAEMRGLLSKLDAALRLLGKHPPTAPQNSKDESGRYALTIRFGGGTAAADASNMASSAATGTAHARALHIVAETAGALADLMDHFQVDDCAAVTRGLAQLAVQVANTPWQPATEGADAGADGRLTTTGADAVAYLRRRAAAMQVYGPDTVVPDEEQQVYERLMLALPAESWQTIDSDEAPGGALDEADLETLRAFQASARREREAQGAAQGAADAQFTPLDLARAGAPDDADDLDALQEMPTRPLAALPPQMGSARFALPSANDLNRISPEVKQAFLGETSEDLQDMGRLLAGYEQRPDDLTPLYVLAQIAHKMKGAGPTLGFDALPRIAIIFGQTIKAIQRRRIPADAVTVTGLAQLFGLLQAALDAAARELAEPAELATEADAIYSALLAREEPPGSAAPDASAPRRGEVSGALAGVAPSAHLPRAIEGETDLRVEIHRLDELMNLLGALSFNRATLLHSRDDILAVQDDIDAALTRLSAVSEQITDLHPLVGGGPSGLLAGPVAQTVAQAPQPLRLLNRLTGGGPGANNGVGGGANNGAGGGASRRQGTREATELEQEQFTELDHSLRALREAVADMGALSATLHERLLQLGQISDAQEALTTDIQQHAMSMRLVPLAEFVHGMRLSVHVLAANLGKQVELQVVGEQAEIDRNIGQSLADPVTQLLQNAVVHGIESPAERIERGKPPTGVIRLSARNEGHEIVITVSDDGQGVNPHRMIAAALAADLLDKAEADTLSEDQALALMFQFGVTSKEEADGVAGSGIGLAQVDEAIRRLKGTIQVESAPGKGARFTIHAPISLSEMRTLRVVAAGQEYAVPFALIERPIWLATATLLRDGPAAPLRLRLPRPTGARPLGDDDFDELLRQVMAEHAEPYDAPDARLTAATADVFGDMFGDGNGNMNGKDQRAAPTPEGQDAGYEEMPAYPLAELLGMEYDLSQARVALIVKRRRSHMAILVDEAREDEVVVVRALPPRLRRPAVHGATVRPDGQLLLLLDLAELLERRLGTTAQPAAPLRPHISPAFAKTSKPRVLVVDDSITIRYTIEQMLRRNGFEVQLASDGLEAMNLLKSDLPRVVLLDIEMPNLDGFELLTILRQRPEYAGVRIAMLTSRTSATYRQRAAGLGADAYLVKPCPEDHLIATLQTLLAVTPAG